MKKIQTQGVHHITMIGADRQTSIDFWEGVMGMPFIFEQPNLDVPAENHLYFDPGDGRLITVFTNENRVPDPARNPEGIGNLHHLAFNVSRATYNRIAAALDERGIQHSGAIDRGFMDSIYFRDPLGQLLECATYKFDAARSPPTPRCSWKHTNYGQRAATTTSAMSIWPTRSPCLSSEISSRCRPIEAPKILIRPSRRSGTKGLVYQHFLIILNTMTLSTGCEPVRRNDRVMTQAG